jgi:hypothetical protein
MILHLSFYGKVFIKTEARADCPDSIASHLRMTMYHAVDKSGDHTTAQFIGVIRGLA